MTRKTGVRECLINAREDYINIIKAELLGPGSEFAAPSIENELISSNPISRYSIGILYPQGNQVNQDNDDAQPNRGYETATLLDDELDGKTDLLLDGSTEIESRTTRHREHDVTATENLDEEIDLSAQYMPSSMGITFVVKGNADLVRGRVSFATYRKGSISDFHIPYAPPEAENYKVPPELAHIMAYDNEERAFRLLTRVTKKEIRDVFERDTLLGDDARIVRQIAYRFADLCHTSFVREPHDEVEFVLDFSNGNYIDNNREIDGTAAKITALRKNIVDDIWTLTVMLVNDMSGVNPEAHNCLFQPILSFSTAENGFLFVESQLATSVHDLDEEEQSLELLYRDKATYGTGLGVSVDWDIDESGSGSLWSDFFPVYEVPPISFELPENQTFEDKHLSMKYLSDLCVTGIDSKLDSLARLVDLYRNWVDELEEVASTLHTRFQPAAARNIADCRRACERMYSGIKVLRDDPNAYDAFALANRAMFMQRVHLRMQSKTSNIDRYPGDEQISELLRNMDYRREDDRDCRWRPFQIAFMLMDVSSVVDDKSPERDVVDLIWFPTGGGKTEAYLGLTAFAIFYRRLSHLYESGGTNVIMRYTLRLLASQQFTRAATMICACESIRRDCEVRKSSYPVYELGREPITIGLWIGSTHIPNRNADAKKHLEELLNVKEPFLLRSQKERHNKFQVLKCPWCGTKLVKDNKDKRIIGLWGYKLRDGKHFYMSCTHEDCDFTYRLPIQIIDEELYENPPTLLFGTVDKFAMLPWDGRIGAFFAVDSNNRSPELIIQDELHLISGSLGTIVGLYETAIDAICSQKGVRPKIVASTATIRRAKEQCSALYNRDVVQFPPSGLDAGDSFFAREASISHKTGVYGRKYVGLMPSGKTKAMMQVRTMAALLQRVHMMELPDEVKDKLWTLTVYFNSLRDLGKASTLVDDDVKDFIIRTANRMFASRRIIVGADELTSRVTTTELNETLDKLEKVEYSTSKKRRYASNILLATNMISVGIDIARLNVMLLVGQPKLTSEYIQASSRVGRSYPGVAFVQFDATKSRDRSHYEGFKAYHGSFYRFVEPTGATPFSKPARERALHAIVTSILRHRAGFSEDKDAGNFDEDYYAGIVSETQRFIVERLEQMNLRSHSGAETGTDDVREEIQTFVSWWHRKAKSAAKSERPLYFGRRFMVKPPGDEVERLFRQYGSSGHDNSLETLSSMRNVDTQVEGKILIWEG